MYDKKMQGFANKTIYFNNFYNVLFSHFTGKFMST